MTLQQGSMDNKVTNKNNEKTRRFTKLILVISSTIVVIALIVVGFFLFMPSSGSSAQAMLTVDGTAITKDYFLKRVKLTNGDPATMLEQLAYEQIVKKVAPEYGIEVSKSDIDEALRKNATLSLGNASGASGLGEISGSTDIAFREWYARQLENTGLSDEEYREITEINIAAARLRDVLAEEIPPSAEQIHLNVMALMTREDAEQARLRISAGESFADVAKEVSVDSLSKSNGGDIGWIPRGVVPYDDVVFHLEVGRVSEPVMVDPSDPENTQYALFLVSEKQAERNIDPYMVQVLSNTTFYRFLKEEMTKHDVEYNFDAETEAWVNEQLSKTGEN